ncbi:MAG TPA: GtrA family protein [Burkholderiaceae bacterium]|nr:GtrA family protein [Burkholderiaceae bacterium]
MLDRTVPKFLAVGVANTIVGLGVIYAMKLFASADDVSANVVGYAVGLAFSFALNRRWTFAAHGDVLGSLLRFLAIFALAYPANLAAVLMFIKIGVDPYWSQALGVVPYTVIFYVGSRWYAFRSSKSSVRR